MALTMLAENWTKVQGMHLAGALAIFRSASAAIHLLSLKAARLRAGAAAEGAEHTLVGKDIVASSEMFRYFPMCLQALVSVIAGIATLIVYAGGAGAAGLAVMLLTLVLTGLVGKDVKPAQAKMLEASEGTAAVTREIVESAKLIKMMLWEELYLEHVCAKRAVELRHIRRYRLCLLYTSPSPRDRG